MTLGFVLPYICEKQADSVPLPLGTFLTNTGGCTYYHTTTLMVPPITTDRIEFWPISMNQQQANDVKNMAGLVPLPRLYPAPIMVVGALGSLGIIPDVVPGFDTIFGAFGLKKRGDSDNSPQCETTALSWVSPWPTTPTSLTFQPQPTVPFQLPTEPPCKPPCSNLPSSSSSSGFIFPTAVQGIILPPSDGPKPPPCKKNCGNRHCRKFGYVKVLKHPSFQRTIVYHSRCGRRDSDSSSGSDDDSDSDNDDIDDDNDSNSDTNDDDDNDHVHSGDESDSHGGRRRKPKKHCGKYHCYGGASTNGCPGECKWNISFVISL